MEKIKLASGSYSGKYLDVRGKNGTVVFDIDVQGEQVSGTCKLTTHDEHSNDVVSGKVSGKVEGEGLQLNLQLGKHQLTYNAKISGAKPYAEIGLFGVVENSESRAFGGGVWIAWKFRDKSNDKK